MNVKNLLILSVLKLFLSFSLSAQDSVELFNGHDLSGWTALPGGEWSVKEGAIVGQQEKSEKRHGMLLSNEVYSDFELEVIYKSLEGNSGLYFRVDKVKSNVSVNGFQAEIDSRGNDAGGLYETGGRAWVVRPPAKLLETCYNHKGWNTMKVIAKGKNIRVYLNGHLTAELKNDPGRTKGHIGLQLHGSQKMHVIYKSILLRK